MTVSALRCSRIVSPVSSAWFQVQSGCVFGGREFPETRLARGGWFSIRPNAQGATYKPVPAPESNRFDNHRLRSYQAILRASIAHHADLRVAGKRGVVRNARALAVGRRLVRGHRPLSLLAQALRGAFLAYPSCGGRPANSGIARGLPVWQMGPTSRRVRVRVRAECKGCQSLCATRPRGGGGRARLPGPDSEQQRRHPSTLLLVYWGMPSTCATPRLMGHSAMDPAECPRMRDTAPALCLPARAKNGRMPTAGTERNKIRGLKAEAARRERRILGNASTGAIEIAFVPPSSGAAGPEGASAPRDAPPGTPRLHLRALEWLWFCEPRPSASTATAANSEECWQRAATEDMPRQ